MEKAFGLAKRKPLPGTIVTAFKTRRDRRQFVRQKGGRKGLWKFWVIRGIIKNNQGLREAIKIKVSKAERDN